MHRYCLPRFSGLDRMPLGYNQAAMAAKPSSIIEDYLMEIYDRPAMAGSSSPRVSRKR